MRGKWIAKAVLQKGIGFLPDPQRANYLFQDRVTRSTVLTDDVVQQRLGWAVMHLEAYDRNGGDRDGFTAVELGSGWYPIIPLGLFLAGADQVHMVDLEDLTRPALVVQAIDHMVGLHDGGGLDDLGSIDPGRVDRLRSVRDAVLDEGHVVALQRIGLRISPMDARQLTLERPPQLIFSNTVFEHIVPDVLEGILERFGELAGPGTVMSHLIDHGDHYAYIDDTIDIHHFLRYSDRVWRWIDNDVQPMNRLRASQYVEMYRRLGLPLTEEHHRDCDPMTLVGVPLADRFRAMDPADVACAASHLVSRFD